MTTQDIKKIEELRTQANTSAKANELKAIARQLGYGLPVDSACWCKQANIDNFINHWFSVYDNIHNNRINELQKDEE